ARTDRCDTPCRSPRRRRPGTRQRSQALRTRRTPTRERPAAPPPRTEPGARPPRARPTIRSSCHPLSRRLDACERAELVVGDAALELRERLAVAALVQPAADQPFDGCLELLARHAPEERRADLRHRPK